VNTTRAEAIDTLSPNSQGAKSIMSSGDAEDNGNRRPTGPSRDAAPRPPAGAPLPGLALGRRPVYIEHDDSLYGLGAGGYVLLARFTAKIVEEIVRRDDHGRVVATALRIEVRPRDPRIARHSILVDPEWFRRQTCWLQLLDPRCSIEPGASDHVARAIREISALSGSIERVEAAPPAEGR
jgi:hypothetical protein